MRKKTFHQTATFRGYLVLNSVLVAAVLLGALIQPLNAGTSYWDSAGTGSWETNTNWSTSASSATPDPVAAPTTGDTAIFNISTLNGSRTVLIETVDAAADGLSFLNTSGITTIRANGTNRALTLGSGGISITGAGTVVLGSTTANQNVTINFGANQVWNTGSSLTVHNTISDGGSGYSLTKSGGAMLIMTQGVGGISGGIDIQQGTLRIGGGSMGAQALSMGAGTTLDYAKAAPGITFSGNITTNTSANFITSSGNNLTHTFSGAITGGADLLFRRNNGTGSNANSYVLSGAVSNVTGDVTVANLNPGTGTQTLSLNKSGGSTAISGDVIVGGTAGTSILRNAADEQISNTATITLNSLGVYQHSSTARVETITKLIVNNTAAAPLDPTNFGKLILGTTATTPSNGRVYMGNGGTLAGTGTVNLPTEVTATGAHIVAGSSIAGTGGGTGTLIISGNLKTTDGSNTYSTAFDFNINGTGATSQLSLTGAADDLSLSSGSHVINFFDLAGTSLLAGTTYQLITGIETGLLESLYSFNFTNASGWALDNSFDSNGYRINAGALEVQFAAVPEPSTYAMLGLGLGALWFLRRKRQQS